MSEKRYWFTLHSENYGSEINYSYQEEAGGPKIGLSFLTRFSLHMQINVITVSKDLNQILQLPWPCIF